MFTVYHFEKQAYIVDMCINYQLLCMVKFHNDTINNEAVQEIRGTV